MQIGKLQIFTIYGREEGKYQKVYNAWKSVKIQIVAVDKYLGKTSYELWDVSSESM